MDGPETELVRVEIHGRVARIVMSAAARRNLLTPAMMDALSAALHQPDARVIVLAAEGPAFCAGHDMKAMARHFDDADGGRAAFTALFDQCSALMERIETLPQPVIADVHATAVAAGCQLVAACDLAIAADTAQFGTTGVTFGLYCSTPAVPLIRGVGRKHAAEMLHTGALISAQEAARIGLINRAVAPEALHTETMALANAIAQKSSAVLSLGKRTLAAQAALPLHEAYREASRAMVENLLMADGREGLNAFAEKRPGVWQDR